MRAATCGACTPAQEPPLTHYHRLVRVEVTMVAVHAAAADLSWALLDDAERRRAERYRFVDDQRRCIVARGTLRMLLGQRLGRDPRELRFVEGPQGKPALQHGELEFNVSHSGDRVAIAIAAGRPVGIDIEREQPRSTDLAVLARRYFSRDEADQIERAEDDEAMRLFFSIWTAKESVIKAAGGGLSIDLSAFSVFPVRAEWSAVQNLSGSANLDGWQVAALRCDEGYRAAICVRGAGGEIVSRDVAAYTLP